VGRKRPRSKGNAARGYAHDDDPPKRSFGRRETSGPPVIPHGALVSMGFPPPRKWRERTGNTRGAGARSSIGWQKSVGRIARLLRREVARPVGGRRALARKKSVAPPDAGRGWAEGETVRVREAKRTVFLHGRSSGVKARRFTTRRKAFSGFCPSCPHRTGRSRVLWFTGQRPSFSRPQGSRLRRTAHRAERNPTRACLGATMRTSEVDAIR